MPTIAAVSVPSTWELPQNCSYQAAQLALDVPLSALRVPQPYLVHVHRMECRQVRRHRLPGSVRAQIEGTSPVSVVADDVSFERTPSRRGFHWHSSSWQSPYVRGTGTGCAAEGRDDPVLANHVVRRGEDVAERRSAKRIGMPRRVGDLVGQVGAPTCDQLVANRQLEALHLGGEPLADPPRVFRRWVRPVPPIACSPAERYRSPTRSA